MEDVGSEGKTSGSHGRQAEAVEEEQKPWKRAEEAGQGLESNGTLQYLPLKTEPSRSKIPYCDTVLIRPTLHFFLENFLPRWPKNFLLI